MPDLISVIVPVYKVEAYLDACVQSIVDQTWRELEILLVDDGSPDRCGAMCDEWAKKDNRIRVIHKENGGPGSARNAGMDAAKGELLAFVDSDDTIAPDHLERLHTALGDCDLAICGIDCKDSYDLTPKTDSFSFEALQSTPSKYLGPAYINSSVNKLYRTRLIRQNHLQMNPEMRRAEDLCFVTDYLLCCRTIAAVDACTYHYRVNPGSITHNFYRGIARDEILGWHIQRRLFLPDPQLCEEERTFFQVWQYGKIQAIFRYILEGKASFHDKRQEIVELMEDADIRRIYTSRPLCASLGRKKLAYAMLADKRLYSLLTLLFCTVGVG